MTKKEIVLIDWLGYNFTKGVYVGLNYEILHEAWQKFRDLKFEDVGQRLTHEQISDKISFRICWGNTINEAFEELIKGIEWYNNLNK